jgi:hypothetical protein
VSRLFKGHVIGEKTCPQCSGAYPKKCWCGGFIHVHVIPDIKMREFLQKDTLFHCDGCAADAPDSGGYDAEAPTDLHQKG